ncbi:SigB/SigF/SigG family RNA polymerase sigma factor [Streptomyces iconiensis]|uniref:SigB/SigF/SigG family RNA polymerase sigma factor n=1 Tax=Streptomyces iconiensis TaxID=1384038 RepID=A0ABT7ABB4_9ACTN|nr:SigB/SigF/SigG family RNA polymerase sigma factor [Streptomyces iconiensis]MDJ1138342.1 SigB/SigF/SigG family RNA polymerase sigma factor [Streptomyces iconiensis]
MSTTTRPGRHDAPNTDADFRAIANMRECPERRRLREGVVTAWLPMAHRLARRYRNRGEALEDLEQVAALALVKSVERYDPERGNAFETFAIPTIDGELKRHFRDNMWEVHVPRRVQSLRNRVRSSLRELELTASGGSGHSPTVAELAAHSGLSEEETLMGLEALHSFTSLSLDAPVTQDTGGGAPEAVHLIDTLTSDDPRYDHIVDREAARTYLCHLPEREQYILYLRFFHEMTQSHIAVLLGISQMHVSRLISSACRRVREEIEGAEQPERPGEHEEHKKADPDPDPGTEADSEAGTGTT